MNASAPNEKIFSLMGHNQKSLPLLPYYGYGSYFPTYLTHKSGAGKDVIDLMRLLIVSGLRAESFRNLMKELPFKN